MKVSNFHYRIMYYINQQGLDQRLALKDKEKDKGGPPRTRT